MGLFRPYKPNDTAADQATNPVGEQVAPDAGKGAPTPTRRQAEQQRRERLNPTLSKRERKQRERELTRVKQEEAYARAEMSPIRVLLRNFIDARWTLSEFSWPFLLIGMAAFLVAAWFPQLTIYSSFIIWGVLAIVLVEVAINWRRFRRLAAERLPGAPTRGLMMYMLSRMTQMRRFRRPGAAIERGAQY